MDGCQAGAEGVDVSWAGGAGEIVVGGFGIVSVEFYVHGVLVEEEVDDAVGLF